MHEILAHEGNGVCGTEFGKALGDGLSELRLRHDADEVLARKQSALKRLRTGKKERSFYVSSSDAHGDKLVLLLGGYDKGADDSEKRQQTEIETARQPGPSGRRRTAAGS